MFNQCRRTLRLRYMEITGDHINTKQHIWDEDSGVMAFSLLLQSTHEIPKLKLR